MGQAIRDDEKLVKVKLDLGYYTFINDADRIMVHKNND